MGCCDGYDLCPRLCLWCSVRKDSVLLTDSHHLATAIVDLLIPSRNYGRWYSWISLWWLSNSVSVLCLRCMTLWSCARQPNPELANCGWNLPCFTGQWCWSEATHTFVRRFSCISTQGLRFDSFISRVVCLRFISCWICAQHNLAMCMLILLLY
jgi:hypothetical protein